MSSVSFGIYAGYVAVTGILFAFGHRKQKKPTPAAPPVTAVVAAAAEPN